MVEENPAYKLNEDGSAVDPLAFKKALLEDPAKVESLKEEPEVFEIVQGDDMQAFQELLKSVYQVSGRMSRIVDHAWRDIPS